MLFNFNQYSSLLLPFAIQGILFFFILLWRGFREERLSDKLLAALILCFTLRIGQWMLGFADWYDVHDWHTTFMFYFRWNYAIFFGPLLWFYFRSLTNRNFKLERSHTVHFILPAITILITLIFFINDVVYYHWIQGQDFPNFHATRGPLLDVKIPWLYNILDVLEKISVFGYFAYTLKKYQEYRKYISENFSDTLDLEFSWLRNFLVVFLAAQIIAYAFNIIDWLIAKELSYIDYWYSHFAWGLVIYYLSIAGFGANRRWDLSLAFEAEGTPEEEQTETTRAEKDVDEDLAQQLAKYMEVEMPHLNADLTLSDLAKQLRTPTGNLSKVINQIYEKNFNDFINAYRVEVVKTKLIAPENSHLSLLGIALDSGFRSKATFNRAFKKYTGNSPTEYLKSLA